MVTVSFVAVLFILLFLCGFFLWSWFSQRRLPPDKRLAFHEHISRHANVATVASIPISVITLVLAWGFQEEAGREAAEQKKLLQQTVIGLNDSAALLKQQADSSRSAASYLERQYAIQSSQREEEIERRAMIPDVRPALEIVNEDGSSQELTVFTGTTWSNYGNPFRVTIRPGTGQFQMNIRIINQGRATLREGTVTLRTGFNLIFNSDS